MWIKHIQGTHYRNIQNLSLELDPGLTILVGNNGQGKTNFIEAVSLCLSGQTFRFAKNNELVSEGKSQSFVTLTIAKDSEGESSSQSSDELRVVLDQGRKVHWLNEKKITASHLPRLFPVILFSPESLSIIKEGSSERRDLIDQFLLTCPHQDPHFNNPVLGHTVDLYDDYGKLLRSRNKVLKDFQTQKISNEMAMALLETYATKFLELAVSVTHLRVQALNRILFDFQSMAGELYPRSHHLSVEYGISGKNALHYSRDQIERELSQRLSELKTAEMAVGHSLVGPHKHEVHFLLNKKDSRIFCSQGQQRALILAFKMAQLMYHRRAYGSTPILILDDVLSELDGQTRENLVRILNSMEGQIFITTTDRYLCHDLKNQRQRYLSVEGGSFSLLK